MLTVSSLKKSFDLQILFENVSFTINPGARIGLIGPNGCGKTTLLRILTGEEAPTAGTVKRDPNLRIGYLPQGFEPDPTATVHEIIGRAAGSATSLEEQLSALATALVNNPSDPQLGQSYDDLLRRIEFAETGRAAEILAGLGLDGIDPAQTANRLSGGQKTRLSLALVLLSDPQILLLDEPTNHLDITMLEWLEDWLSESSCGALIISHDRTFLDNTVTAILDMDPLHHSLRAYAGNYSDYLEQRQAEIEKQWTAYSDQQTEIERMQQDIARVRAQAEKTEQQSRSVRKGGREMRNKGVKGYHRRMAGKVAKKAKSREKRLERYIADDERVERPRESVQIKIAFSDTPHLGRSVIRLDNLCVGYTPDRPLLQRLTLDVQPGQRIVVTGPNGSGKTTLLRTLTGELPPLSGAVHFGPTVRLGYMSQDQSSLDPQRSALDTLLPAFANQTEARRFLASFLFTGDEPLKSIVQLSYGQRARLMLAALVAQECNCLLLDEPINHLDIPSRAQFEEALAHFNGAVLAVVHDRYFIERFASVVWWVEDGTVEAQLME